MITITDNAPIESLLSLNKYVHDWHVRSYPTIFRNSAEGDFRQYFRSKLENPNYYHYIAYDDSNAIGLIQAEIRTINENAFCFSNRLIFVHIIVVHPEYRSKNVGHLLMNKVYDLADNNGISRIELDHWDGNESASSFFGELGFKPFRHYLYIERGEKNL